MGTENYLTEHDFTENYLTEHDVTEHPLGLSRRAVLGGLAAGTILGGTGVALPAQAHGTIRTYRGIDGQRTVYEVSRRLASFGYRPSFHDRLNSWLEFWDANTPGSFHRPFRVWSYGAHYDGRPSAAHNSGRGFDLSRIRVTNGSGNRVQRFNARWDIWQDWPTAKRNLARRRYWATSASAHHHFRNVLTYAYDPAGHHNHIHIDNLVSGSGNSSFTTGSKAQVIHVQACCRYVWGLATDVDGIWGPQTRRHSTRVLRAAGIESGSLTTSKAKWLAFNRHTLRRGYGTQSYPSP